MKGYTQLAQEERYQIYAWKKAGWTQKAIALELEVHPSTISRELRRNTGRRGYRPRQAHALASARQQQRARCPRISAECWAIVTRDCEISGRPSKPPGASERNAVFE